MSLVDLTKFPIKTLPIPDIGLVQTQLSAEILLGNFRFLPPPKFFLSG